MKFKKSTKLSLILVISLLSSEVISAVSAPLYLSMIGTGWDSDTVSLFFTAPIPNPAGCPIPDGVILTASMPGYKTHYASVLTAYALGKPIRLVIADNVCVYSRPKLWGMYF